MNTVKLSAGCAIVLCGLVSVQAKGQQATHPERTLVDSVTQIKWVLQVDPRHPGGPGKLVPHFAPSAPLALQASNSDHARAVIRAGDLLLVDESTQVLVARFAAVALAPARMGDIILARFGAGMNPVPVRALGPGRAEFVAPSRPEEQQ